MMKAGEKWRNSLSKKERQSIERYTNSEDMDYITINRMLKSLRDGKSPTKTDETLTNALNKSEAPCDMTVARCFYASTMNGDIAAGKMITDKAFVSSSIDHKSATDLFSGRDSITATISVYKGSKGAYVQPLSNEPKEYEWLFPPNARFKVLSVSSDGQNVSLAYMGSRSSKSKKSIDDFLVKSAKDDNADSSKGTFRIDRFTWNDRDIGIEDPDVKDDAYWDEIQNRDPDEGKGDGSFLPDADDDDTKSDDKNKSLEIAISDVWEIIKSLIKFQAAYVKLKMLLLASEKTCDVRQLASAKKAIRQNKRLYTRLFEHAQ